MSNLSKRAYYTIGNYEVVINYIDKSYTLKLRQNIFHINTFEKVFINTNAILFLVNEHNLEYIYIGDTIMEFCSEKPIIYFKTEIVSNNSYSYAKDLKNNAYVFIEHDFNYKIVLIKSFFEYCCDYDFDLNKFNINSYLIIM